MIGACSTIIEGIKITAGCVVGAGATVVRDLTEPGVYVGSPARRLE
jgi:acetyltransferase-like isoleucine patch superfamily enzyme